MLPLFLPKTTGKPFTIGSLNLSADWRADMGVKSNGANQFTAANSEGFSIADNAALSTGDVSFTIAGWVYVNSWANFRTFFAKGTPTHALGEYFIAGRADSSIQFSLLSAPSTQTDAISVSTFSTGTWIHVLGQHDAAADNFTLYVNNTLEKTTALVGGPADRTGDFRIGSGNLVGWYHNGREKSVLFYKRVLTAAERTYLYNSGTARNMSEIAAHSTLNDAIAGWDLNATYGQANDSFGTNHLTNNNTVEAIGGNGTEIDPPPDRGAVTKQVDQSGNGRDLTSTGNATIPSYETAEINSKPVVRYDGVNDISTTPDFADVGNGNKEISVFMVIRGTAVTNRHILAHWDTNSQRSWVFGKGNANNAKMRVQLSGDGAAVGKDYESSTTVFGDSNAHIVGFTYDGTALNLYVDSKTAESSPTKTVDSATPTLHNSTAAISEGASLATGAGASHASVDVAERVIKNAKLSNSQISNLIGLWASTYNITLS